MNVKTQHSDKFCYYAAECEEASRDHQTYSVVTKTVCYGIIVFLLERFVIRSDELATTAEVVRICIKRTQLPDSKSTKKISIRNEMNILPGSVSFLNILLLLFPVSWCCITTAGKRAGFKATLHIIPESCLNRGRIKVAICHLFLHYYNKNK